jgi:hypothetical protein
VRAAWEQNRGPESGVIMKLSRNLIRVHAWIAFVCFVLSICQLGTLKAEAALGPTQAIMGEDFTIPVSYLLSSADKTAYANDCTASSLSLKISSLTGESVFEKYDSFSTEHCFSKKTQWSENLLWEKTSCFSSSETCILFPNDKLIAAPGQYDVEVNIEVGFETPITLTNIFTITVLPSYFYFIEVNSDSVFPYKDGYADNVEGSIAAFNENGEALDAPISKVGVKQGNKLLAHSSSDVSGFFSIKIPQTAKSDLEVVIVSMPNAVGGRKWILLNQADRVYVKSTKIKSVNLDVPEEIYPSKDGFKDTATISYGATVTTGKKSSLVGKMSISNGSKIIKKITFGATGSKKFVWDGKVNGEVIPGRYYISVSATGPEGGTITKKKSISVSKKKMVTSTISKTYGAYSAADESQGDSFLPIQRWGSQGARFYSSGDPDFMLVKLSVPINSSTVKWRIRFNDVLSTGSFVYYPCRTSNCLSSYISTNYLVFTEDSGDAWTPWARLSGNYANFEIASTDWGSLVVDSFTVEYVVQTLK